MWNKAVYVSTSLFLWSFSAEDQPVNIYFWCEKGRDSSESELLEPSALNSCSNDVLAYPI